VPGVVDAMQPLLGKDTAVVTAQNGVPWWYFYKLEGEHRDRRVESVDPGGVLWDRIGPERAIGCVVYPACEIAEPGVVKHLSSNRFPLGEPSGEKTERLLALSKAMVASNLKAPVRPKIRDDIWIKLWGNLSFNPISALTCATLDKIVEDEGTHAVARAMMVEAQAIGEKLGVRFPIDVDKRIAGAGDVGAHKTSMLQDLEQGRPMEIDALVTAVQELGRLVEIPTPAIDIVLALVRQRAQTAGCYG
jgi:2-dehydropantoate 2-reductase